MQRNREIILENPFHPLDLSPHDLLAIYKRFEESRVINRNPKQELPIDTIAQLISSLKGCPPSYIQKCISQALIKDTISWNDFLTFLDQQSEVRQRILEWLMYEKSTLKYKEDKEWPFRAKINRFYQEITFLKFIELNETEKVILCSIDKIEYYLFSQNNGRILLIDKYINKTENNNFEGMLIKPEQQRFSNPSLSLNNPLKPYKKPQGNQISRSQNKNQRSQRDRIMSSFINPSSKASQVTISKDEEEAFFKRERKNINSLFNVFKDLSIEDSVAYAKVVSQKISEKNMNPSQISMIKESFSGLQEARTLTEKKLARGPVNLRTVEKAKTYLSKFHEHKKLLSYNPYTTPKNYDNCEGEFPRMSKMKKITKQRKQRQYNHLANHEAYNPKLRCLAIMYFNMQLVLVKLLREYNKISLEQQDKLKILTENQHKKNEVIEDIDFYFHSIVNKWFLIVLIRVQYKNQSRNENESYIRGYQIQLIDKKLRTDKDYRFKDKKEAFTLQLCSKDRNNQEELIRHQIFSMEMQFQYGIHFISVSGKYLCFKEDYIEKKGKGEEDQYFTFLHEQKFKNAGLSLSCLSVGVEANKIVFGTIRGVIIIYDMFSHIFRLKKVSNSQIAQVKIIGTSAYILTLDEKFIVLDLTKGEQIQHTSIRNQTKLHQKIKKFQLNKNIIYFYGTEVRSYNQFVDQKILHQHRKMQTMYKWRLDRLFKDQSSFKKENKFANKDVKMLMPFNAASKGKNVGVQMVIASQSYFLVLTQILQLIVVQKKSLRIKFTMILDIGHDSKVMKMSISSNQKLLALLLFNHNICIFNIHTQDLYQTIKPSPYLKFTTLCFLDPKNEFLLASGTEAGKIVLSPFSSIPQKNPKMLQFHSRAVTSMMIVKKDSPSNENQSQYLVSCGEDLVITVWLLPFNILKHEIKINADIGYVLQEIGSYKQLAYLRTFEGHIIQANIHEGKLVKTMRGYRHWTAATVDNCTGDILGIYNKDTLEVLERGKDGWRTKCKVPFDILKGQIKSLGVVQSEKAVVFMDSGVILPWSYQSSKFNKPINLCSE